MSLRKALIALPGDRDTLAAVRGVVGYFDTHRGMPVDVVKVAHVAGISEVRAESVMRVLSDTFVIDCDGDPRSGTCTFSPDSVLELEVRRFLRSQDAGTSDLQRGVSRFRDRYGAGR